MAGTVAAMFEEQHMIVRILGTATAILGPVFVLSAWRERVWERAPQPLVNVAGDITCNVVSYTRSRVACAHQAFAMLIGPVTYWAIIIALK